MVQPLWQPLELPSAPKSRITGEDIDAGIGMVWFKCTDCAVAGIRPSGSMRPLIDWPSHIVFKAISYEDARVGDFVIVQIDKEHQVFHRLAVKSKEGFRTQAMSSEYLDLDQWKPEQLVGVAVAIIY